MALQQQLKNQSTSHQQALVSALSAVAVRGQQVGTLTAENHPSMTWQRCTAENQCSTVNGQVVLDANWRYLHQTSSSTNCYTGNTWDTSICSTDASCATACALDGADYSGTYGITASGNSLKLGFVTHGPFSTNIGSRNYLMADTNTYQIFDLLNNEFTFDVDVSNLPCGLNGALYFVSMAANGDAGGSNAAGAKYGTGYCDSQCPRDLKFIAGQVRFLSLCNNTILFGYSRVFEYKKCHYYNKC
jgi:cellulose 1,4-beta-cellobiosidase